MESISKEDRKQIIENAKDSIRPIIKEYCDAFGFEPIAAIYELRNVFLDACCELKLEFDKGKNNESGTN